MILIEKFLEFAPKQPFGAVRKTFAGIPRAGDDEPIERLVEDFRRELDLARELLLDPEVVMHRAVGLEALLGGGRRLRVVENEEGIGLDGARRLVEETDAAFDRRSGK